MLKMFRMIYVILLYPYHINDKILFSTVPWIFNKVYFSFATVNILGTPVIDV